VGLRSCSADILYPCKLDPVKELDSVILMGSRKGIRLGIVYINNAQSKTSLRARCIVQMRIIVLSMQKNL
jgi:hypothetical protein